MTRLAVYDPPYMCSSSGVCGPSVEESLVPSALAALPASSVFLQPHNLVGIDALRTLGTPSVPDTEDIQLPVSLPSVDVPRLDRLVDAVESDGHGLVMVMGKGGVRLSERYIPDTE